MNRLLQGTHSPPVTIIITFDNKNDFKYVVICARIRSVLPLYMMGADWLSMGHKERGPEYTAGIGTERPSSGYI